MKNNEAQQTADNDKKIIVIGHSEEGAWLIERALNKALPRCEQAAALLRNFGIHPTANLLHDCVTMTEDIEEEEDLTPSFQGFSEDSKWVHTMTTKAVFDNCPTLDKKLSEMLKQRTNGMIPNEAKDFTDKFNADVKALKEALIKCFKSNSSEEDIKNAVLKYITTDTRGNVKTVDDIESRIEKDTSIVVDTPESIASYEAHKKAAEAINAFVDTLINADRLSVVSDIRQLFNVDPDTLKLSPSIINYKLFSEK